MLLAALWLVSGAFGTPAGLLVTALDIAAFAITGSVAIPLATAVVGGAIVFGRTPASHAAENAFVPLARELALLLGGLTLYTVGRTLVESGAGSARDNTARIVDFERGLRLFFEADLQSWALESEWLIRSMNWMYSFGFLAAMAGTLLWLWAHDRDSYRLLRNSLGISAILAVAVIALYPAAPPRLTPATGIIDSVVFFGREHTFVNEYAAMPSLHVGWLAAAGFVVGRRLRGPAAGFVMVAPGALMMFTVIVTGNHFWLDGVVGIIITVGPALLLIHGATFMTRSSGVSGALGLAPQGAARVLFTAGGLGSLLAYLLIAQWLTPGFTNYWGYLTGQVAVFLALAIAGEFIFAREGGLSWATHLLAVVCAYADVLGTDGNLYASIDEYDKLTHFLGVAAATAGLYDVLRALSKRGVLAWAPADRFVASVVFGVILGIGWEAYEYLGDVVFHTTRVNSRLDTINDLVFDTMGALLIALLMMRAEQADREQEAAIAGTHATALSPVEDDGTLTRA